MNPFPRMERETILVVEDEGIIAMHLQRMLVSFGFNVPETVESGPAALRSVERLRPGLVLMDIQLQGEMDGIETACRIHEKADTPVVFLTAYAEDQRLEKARRAEPYGYLVKPVQERTLRATIEMALYKHQVDRRLRESEAAYRELYNLTPAMFHTTLPDWRIQQVSDYWLSLLGYTRDEVIGRSMMDFVDPGSRGYIAETVTPELTSSGRVQDVECVFLRKDGRPLDILFSTVGVFGERGDLLHSHSALIDITARKRAETAERDQRALAEALRDTAAALSSTLSFTEVLDRVMTNVARVVPHDGVCIMLVEDGQAFIVRSHGFERALAELPAGRRWDVDKEPTLRLLAETGDSLVMADTRAAPGWEIDWARSYAGAPIIIKAELVGFIHLISLQPGFFNDEHASRLRVFADQAAVAIERARLYDEVKRLATIDEVTGIANRRRLFELGEFEFERARRYKKPLAAVLLDIDHFKQVNDTYGHHAGDRVLAALARAIQAGVRQIDLFGRYGGEEFVLLLPEADLAAAAEVAERLCARVENLRIQTDRGVLQVTVSLGVAMLTPGVPSLANLIDRADQAMYAAKQAGRNRVELYR